MTAFNSTNQEFNKIREELVKDLKIIQTEYVNSQKKLKMAEEIIKKTKVEYKKLNDKYVKLLDYKDKCEKFIQYLQSENNKSIQKLNNLYERQQQNHNNKYKNIRNNYQLQAKGAERLIDQQEDQEEEEKVEQEELEQEQEEQEEEEEEEDITEKPLITKKKANRPPPSKIRKKI